MRAAQFPERTTPPRSGKVTPFLNDLNRLWNEGCHNARTLTKELQRLGYRGSYFSVRSAVARWRRAQRRGHNLAEGQARRVSPANKAPSARQVAWLLFLNEQELEPTEQRLVRAIQVSVLRLVWPPI
jgi:transposase